MTERIANYQIPELLAPAGSLEKLKTVISYGADAVYLGGINFGLRAAAENFTIPELEEGVKFAHARKAKVYVVINAFPFDEDLEQLPGFLEDLERIGVDALIVSDIGAITVIIKSTHIPVHLSTQASCVNAYSAKLWKDLGVERVILGREVSLEEAKRIKNYADVDLEMFIHGSMCMAYSGNCTISNFTQGRDSNRGGCAHSCRFEYTLRDEKGTVSKDFFMSSKDLEGVDLIPLFASCGIDSMKIEGRMKGPLYAATVTKVYRKALDTFAKEGKISVELIKKLKEELSKFSHRKYSHGSLSGAAGKESIYDEREHEKSPYQVVGTVQEVGSDFAILETKGKIFPDTSLDLLLFNGEEKTFKLNKILDLSGEELEWTRPNQLIRIPKFDSIARRNVVRGQL